MQNANAHISHFCFSLSLLVIAAQFSPAQTFSVLYSFTGTPDGASPFNAGVIRDKAGNLYGTTAGGGTANQYGTVFEVTATGEEKILYRFAGQADGAYPWDALVRDGAGNLYGTTSRGGNLSACSGLGCGAIFEITPAGVGKVLYNFNGGTDGANPFAGLVRDSAGNLYGTTYLGGTYNAGTVFKVTSAGVETVLHTFNGMSDGANPYGRLIRDSAGNLYGTTYSGGTFSKGTVFRVDPTGVFTTLFNFSDWRTGTNPVGGLLRAAGNLYGTTVGGAYGKGAVFKLSSTGVETVLYNFRGGTDGVHPVGDLVRDPSGNLYGVTTFGGSDSDGTVFKLSPTGVETVLHRFTGPDGSEPNRGLVLDSSGNLYGTTYSGGNGPYGTVFELTP